ncbi:MFS transporter [Prochlorothrix hollandica]|uniref:MFS transporter n=1 Tax=Prochlorothrix hollandica TaxID=1223 RepID=UPI00193090B8|nr:MFS transporter [Prochlorothrix hollandica]
MSTSLNLQPSTSRQARPLHPWISRILKGFNLRPEEVERTLWMFIFYMAFSMGMTWLEASSIALFLSEYGAEFLPWIAVVTALTGSVMGATYSWLQRVLPLRTLVVLVPTAMAAVLLLLRVGLSFSNVLILNLSVLSLTIFLLRLWAEALFTISELNTAIAANQLFNIREIKRTYPIISSGVLVADVVSGFALPLLLLALGGETAGLHNVIVVASLMMIGGCGALLYLSNRYEQAFPNTVGRIQSIDQVELTSRRIRGPLKRYTTALVLFFVFAQLLLVLIEFQFYFQLGERYDAAQIASFLGLFNGVLGLFEITTQWFLSSRLIERWGVFLTASILPGFIVLLSFLSLTQIISLLSGLLFLKFFDELLRYTLIASTGPVLFQPIPDYVRSQIQSMRGISDPIASGIMGAIILFSLWYLQRFYPGSPDLRNYFFLALTVFFGVIWIYSVWLLRRGYVRLLVLSAERGQLSGANFDLRALKQAVIGALENNSPEAEKRSCIELLSQLYPESVAEVLAPLLRRFTPKLQYQSLELMLEHPDPNYLGDVRELLDASVPPDVLAVALRYVWLTESDPKLDQLRRYLRPEVDATVRATAGALMLRLGSPQQRAEATQTLRRMLTHKRERERVKGCEALGDAVHMQALRLYIPDLLQDPSLRVRQAILEAIAATRIEEYYPSLIRGLYYSSTRESSMVGLVRLDNAVLPQLVALASNAHKPTVVRIQAWNVIGKIGTLEALDQLVVNLTASWGDTRRNILQILLKLPYENGINAVLDRLDGRRGVEDLVDQELILVGKLHAATLDLPPEELGGLEADLLRRAIEDQQSDAIDRIFLLLRFLYPASAIQAADFCLRSNVLGSIARGIEILDNTLDIPNKRKLLVILDKRPVLEKFQALADLLDREDTDRLAPSGRLRKLLDSSDYLGDWLLACCFHVARRYRWSIAPDKALGSLRHPTGFVREAVISYIAMASPRALYKLLPLIQTDPAPLVAAQAHVLLGHIEEQRRIQGTSTPAFMPSGTP